MNYIDNWFHFYETTKSFEAHMEQGVINPDSICFLKQTGQVYTQGSFFGINKEKYDELEQLVLEHEAKINDILGLEGPSVGDGIINTIADLVGFLDGFTDKDNLKDFLDIMKATLENQIDTVNSTLSDRITKLSDEIHADLDVINNSLDTVKSHIDVIDSRLDGHDTEITNLNDSLTSHVNDYNNLKSSYETFKTYTENKFSSLDSSIDTINSNINTLQQMFDEFDRKFDEVENDAAAIGAALEKTLVKFDEFKAETNKSIEDFKALKGAPNGIAPLDGNSQVPSAYLPSYVDDVLEYASVSLFPAIGETGKIYVSKDTNLTYRWSGSAYIEISKSLGLGETSSTAYPGNKGKKNADDIAAHKADTSNPHQVTKAQLGLGNVNNTSDLDKPISTATQNALNTLGTSLDTHVADKTNPHDVTKAQIGLGNTDNTSDADKPVSTAQRAAIDAVNNALTNHKNDTSNPHKVTKSQVGLGNVDNTSDTNKPVSTAQAAAIKVVQDDLTSHKNNKSNPHSVTKTQVGLGNVDNTSDVDKPVSSAVQAALNNKVDKISGKGLSENDFTDELKSKLESIEKTPNVFHIILGSTTLTFSYQDFEFQDIKIGDIIHFDSAFTQWIYNEAIVISKDERPGVLCLVEQVNFPSNKRYIKVVGFDFSNNTYDFEIIGDQNVQADWNVTDATSDAYIRNKPTSMPASDVYDWAKASTKPTYTKAEVGLGNVDNTADKDKPISDATQTALNGKVDKVAGKGLSTNDFTNDDKAKLDSSTSIRKLTTQEINALTTKNVGDLVYNTTTNKYVYWNGTSWEEVGSGSGDVPSNCVTRNELDTELDAIDAVIDTKVDKVNGKGLSTNDYSTAEKNKLAKLTGSVVALTQSQYDALTAKDSETLYIVD